MAGRVWSRNSQVKGRQWWRWWRWGSWGRWWWQ